MVISEKSQEKFLKKIEALRSRVKELERSEAERRRTKQTLQESKEQLSVIFNNTSDLQSLISVEPDGEFRVLNVNNAIIATAHRLGFDASRKFFINASVFLHIYVSFELGL